MEIQKDDKSLKVQLFYINPKNSHIHINLPPQKTDTDQCFYLPFSSFHLKA